VIVPGSQHGFQARRRSVKERRVFVLDTNVLMHDPAAIFRFQEHDVFLPMVVLEELDAAKKGVSEVARNVRQATRMLYDLVERDDAEDIEHGIALPAANGETPPGRVFFQTQTVPDTLPETLPGTRPDNSILGTAMALQAQRSDATVILVSKDINLRIKARVLGILSEDYYEDLVLEDVNLLYGGTAALDPRYWSEQANVLDSWQEAGRAFYVVEGPETVAWHPNQCLYSTGEDGFEAIVRGVEGRRGTLELAHDYQSPRSSVWGISARNREQSFALNLLLEPEVDFVTLLGTAGTGKTLLALAAGLVQTLEDKRYREIVMTRVTVPVGDDIGFLPGTEEEKMTPWMGALMDNLEVLTDSEVGGEWGRAATHDLLHSRIKVRSLNFMRGRTFLGRYLIIDEAQNLTRKQMKTLITRAGPGTKVVCIGNVAQIDTPYLTETTSGLTYVVDRFKQWPHSGHITLRRGERSRLADFAAEEL
jgi:PhoH-like ATPase